MHRVVEPEALIVRRRELHVVGIGGLRPLGTRYHLERARRREGARLGVCAHDTLKSTPRRPCRRGAGRSGRPERSGGPEGCNNARAGGVSFSIFPMSPRALLVHPGAGGG